MVSLCFFRAACKQAHTNTNRVGVSVTVVFLLYLKILWHSGLFWRSTFPHACRGRTAVLFPTQLTTLFCCVELPLKGVSKTPAWYSMLAMPCWWGLGRPKQLSVAANWLGEMVVCMRDVLATLGWCLCHLAFFVVLRRQGMQCKNKLGDTTFLLPCFSVVCMNINNCAMFDKILDSASFCRELP